MALSKILPYPKTIKNPKKWLTFGENDLCHLSNFLQTNIFETLMIFLAPTIELITEKFMTIRLLVFYVSSKKDLCLNSVEYLFS